jgi:hypothetical protein
LRKKKTKKKKKNNKRVERCYERDDDERVVVSLHQPSPPKGVSLFTRDNLQTLVQLEPTENGLSFRVDDRDNDDERGRPQTNESAKKTKQGRVRARPTPIGSKNGRSASRVDRFKREGKEERKNSYDDPERHEERGKGGGF